MRWAGKIQTITWWERIWLLGLKKKYSIEILGDFKYVIVYKTWKGVMYILDYKTEALK